MASGRDGSGATGSEAETSTLADPNWGKLPEVNPGPAPKDMSQEAWDAYVRGVVLKWSDFPFEDAHDHREIERLKRQLGSGFVVR